MSVPPHPFLLFTLMISCGAIEGTPKDWRQMMDINVIALCLCTREAVGSMRERGVDDGHIININSMAGHRLTVIPMNFYSMTKHAVTAFNEGLRRELRQADSNIRISSISPGLVETEILLNSGLEKNSAEKMMQSQSCLKADDIVDTLVHILAAPPHVQIHDVLVRDTQQIS